MRTPTVSRWRRWRARSQDGFTLVETMMTCVVMAIVMAAAVPTVSIVYSLTTTVQNTYEAVNQLVLASEAVTRYIHEAVASSPANTPFVSATADTVTFYSDTGKAGPEKVAAAVLTAGATRSFDLTITPAQSASCPPCTYGASPAGYVLINYLTNGTGASPVFTYTLQGGGTCGGPPPSSPTTTLATTGALTSGTAYTKLYVTGTALTVASGDSIVVGSGSTFQTFTATGAEVTGSPSYIPVTSLVANHSYGSGTSVYDDACTPTQVSEITAVSLDFEATKNPGGQPSGYKSMAYMFAPGYSATLG